MPGSAKALFDAAPEEGAAQAPQGAKALFDAAPADTPAAAPSEPGLGARVLGTIGRATSAVKGGIEQGLNDIGEAYNIPKLLSALGVKPSGPIQSPPSQGILKKDSPDWLAGIDAFVGGMPGASQPYASPGAEHEARAGQFAKENPWWALGLPLAGGLAQPMPAGPPVGAVNDAPSGLSALGAAMQKMGIKSGRKALSGGGSISLEKELSDAAVREALDSNSIRPFGTIGGADARLRALRGELGRTKGEIVANLKASGVEGPEAEAVGVAFEAAKGETSAYTMNEAVPRVYDSAADMARSKPTVNGRLGLDQAEKMKDSLQRNAQAAYRKEGRGSEVGDAQKHAASIMRQSVEDEIYAQANKAPEIAAQFNPIKERLGNVIEASNVARKGAVRAGRNNGTSLTDTVAAAGGLAAGGPGGAVGGGVANKLWRTRGPSTMAWTEYKAGGLVQRLGQMAITDPGRLGRFAAPLANAVQRGPDALSVAHFALSTDPDYQRMTREATNDGAAQ